MSVKILNHTYAIHWSKSMLPSGNYGLCEFETCAIHIAPDISASHQAETLLHEIIHAINHAFGNDDKTKEEQYTSTIAIGMCCIAADNPEIFQWILANSRGQQNINNQDHA